MYTPDPKRYDDCMRYVRCGNSGVLLPAISLGLWHNFGGVDPFERSLAMATYAFDHGVTHFDLANNYGPPYGSAEETFGLIMRKALAPYRDELFISTKAGYDMWPGPYGNWGSRKYLMASLDQSLKRMNLEYVDLFYSHRFDPETPIEETLQALVDIVKMGKALYIGISNWPAEPLAKAIPYLKDRDVPLLIYQGKYNIFNREPANNGVLDLVAKENIGFIAFSPLAQGMLTNRYLGGIPADSRVARGGHLKESSLSPEKLKQIAALDEIAKARGCSLAEMALAWIMADRRVTSVLVGSSSVAQLSDNLASLNVVPLTPDELKAIDAASGYPRDDRFKGFKFVPSSK